MARATARAAPAAGVAASTASRGWHRARIWTAPRLERTGQTLEERVAPKLAAMLSNAAHRIDPAPPKRRRWPLVAGGLVLAAGLSGTAAYLMNRRGSASQQPGDAPQAPRPEAAPETAEQTAGSDANGRVRTP